MNANAMDYSVIKIDAAQATFEQTKMREAILSSGYHRLECYRWLIANDATIHACYSRSLDVAAGDPLFTLLALVNLKSHLQPIAPNNERQQTAPELSERDARFMLRQMRRVLTGQPITSTEDYRKLLAESRARVGLPLQPIAPK